MESNIVVSYFENQKVEWCNASLGACIEYTKLYLFYANLAWRQSRLLRDPFAFGSFKHRFAIFKNPPRPGKDGDIDLSQRPGLGVEINQDLIITA